MACGLGSARRLSKRGSEKAPLNLHVWAFCRNTQVRRHAQNVGKTADTERRSKTTVIEHKPRKGR